MRGPVIGILLRFLLKLLVLSTVQEEKHLELSLVRLFYNERDIDEVMEDINHKNHALQKEVKKKDKIEDEMKDKKKEQGKLTRELTKVEATIKESVRSY